MTRLLPIAATFALTLLPFVTGCVTADCPAGEVALDGACFPEEALEIAGDARPIACASPCSAPTARCDYRSGTCAACALDRHCTDARASRCDRTTGTCAPCVDDGGCVHLPGTPRCDVELGRCVACTPATEAEVCGTTSCDATTGRCTETPRRSVAACAPCRASSECPVDYACVSYAWYDHEPETVCLPDRSALSCATTPGARAPFVRPLDTTDLRGADVTVCAPPSTCGAWFAYRDASPCAFATDCGGPLGASYCAVPSGSTTGTCSMWCASVESGYAGCLAGHACDGAYCAPE